LEDEATDFGRLHGRLWRLAGHKYSMIKHRILEGEEVTNLGWVGAQKVRK
jgi:hypothetical protein